MFTISYPIADIPLAEVKLGQLGSWLNRRNLHPVAMFQATARAYYRWLNAYHFPKYASYPIFFFQFIAMSSTFYYFLYYPKMLSKYNSLFYIDYN